MKQALYYSIASAAIAGLLTGGVMKLGPDALAEMGGPQILIAGSGERVVTQDYGAGGALFTSRNGEIPEYVIGTDWSQQAGYVLTSDVYDDGYSEADYGYAPTAPAPDPNIDDAVFVAPVKISSPPKPRPVSYPSIDGDIVGDHEEPDAALTEVVEAQEDLEHLPS